MTTIPASQIVDVIPNVLAAGGTALSLNGLLLTTSTRVPIGEVQSFPDTDSVSDYFGLSSTEAALAAVYFEGYDNSNAKPGQIMFGQYNTAAVAAYLRGGDVSGLSLTALQAINGTLTAIIDGYTHTAGSLNLSAATSFSNAASIINTAINTSQPVQASVTGSIATTVLTVTAIISGTLAVGQTLSGSGVTAGTTITALGTGTGGTGTYTVSASQTVTSTTITAASTPIVVSYDATSGGFVVTSGITGVPSTAAFATGSTSTALKLTSATGAVISQGAAASTPSGAMDTFASVTQNWATFMTCFDPDVSGNANKLLFATWASLQNNRYAYVCWDTDGAPAASSNATSSLGYLLDQGNFSGTILTWVASADASKAAFICGWAASLDFTQTNGRTTLAFRSQAGLQPDVVTAAAASNLQANHYNFYGTYATASDQFTWEYNGVISGEFVWADSYVNQIKMNADFQEALMILMRDAGSIPYNAQGRGMIEAALLDTIQTHLNFGAIRAGVTLSSSQSAQVNASAGRNITPILQTRGWYLQVLDAAPQVRAARGSPPCNFWYMDGGSVQKISLTSVELQ